MFWKYLFLDMKRAVISWKFLIAVLGVTLTFLLLGEKPSDFHGIINIYQTNIDQIYALLVFVFCILPYGDGLCRDVECRFYQMMIIRGKVRNYAVSKAVSIFMVSTLTMVIGTGLYIFLLRIWYPQAVWLSEGYVKGAFSGLILSGSYGFYLFLCSIKMGFLTGILALVSVAASLYIANRLFALSLPIISFYMLNYVSQMILYPYSFNWVFNPLYEVYKDEWTTMAITVLVTLLFFVMFTYIISRRLQRRLKNE